MLRDRIADMMRSGVDWGRVLEINVNSDIGDIHNGYAYITFNGVVGARTH